MHAKEPVSWKAVVLRRRQEIKEILYKAVDLNLQEEEEWDLECADGTSDESDHCLQGSSLVILLRYLNQIFPNGQMTLKSGTQENNPFFALFYLLLSFNGILFTHQ